MFSWVELVRWFKMRAGVWRRGRSGSRAQHWLVCSWSSLPREASAIALEAAREKQTNEELDKKQACTRWEQFYLGGRNSNRLHNINKRWAERYMTTNRHTNRSRLHRPSEDVRGWSQWRGLACSSHPQSPLLIHAGFIRALRVQVPRRTSMFFIWVFFTLDVSVWTWKTTCFQWCSLVQSFAAYSFTFRCWTIRTITWHD